MRQTNKSNSNDENEEKQSLAGSTPDVNIINVLRSAFEPVDPKSVKR